MTFRYKHELDPSGIPQFGLVAEQVEKVNPDLVARDEHGKPYSVRYEAVNAMLLNEFLKEHGGPLDLASPYRFVTSSMCPYFIISADKDSAPLEQYPDMINALDAAGVTNYEAILLADTRSHGFQFWSVVKDDVISFLGAAFAGDPTITTQPADTTVAVGQTAKFRVTATGTAPLSCQWQKDGLSITRATRRSYTTPPTTAADNGSLFSVVVSNRHGSVTSNNATLTVH